MGRWIEAVDAWAGPWSEAMMRASWQGGLGLALVWAWCRAVPRTPAAVQCWLWRLGYAKLLVALLWATPMDLPVLPAPQPPRALQSAAPPAPLAPVPGGHAPPPALVAHSPPPSAEAVVPSRDAVPVVARPSVTSALLAAWLVGVVICAARTARAYAAAARLRSRCEPLEEGAVTHAVRGLSLRLGLRRPPRVALCPEAGGPLLMGLLRPLIVLPRDLPDAMGAGQLRLMLAHELAHLRRRDLAWGWLAAAAESLFFFHPAVWLARRQWRLAQEIACDEAAVAVTRSKPAEYGRALLEVVEAQCLPHKPRLAPVAAAGVIESVKTIERRLRAMRHFQIQPSSRARRILTGGLVAFVAAVGVLPWRVVAQQDEAQPAEDRPAAKGDDDGGSARDGDDTVGPRRAAVDVPARKDPNVRNANVNNRSGDNRPARRPEGGDIESLGPFSGWLSARKVQVMSRADGTISKVGFKEGEPVKKGQLLFELDNHRLHAKLQAAEAELKGAQIYLERVSRLAKTHDISQSEADEARSKVLIAESAYQMVKHELDETQAAAPFDGVATTAAEVGQYVKEGVLLTTVVEVDVINVECEVPSKHVSRLRAGLAVEVEVDESGRKFGGELTYVAPDMDPRSQVVRVKARLADAAGQVKPGMRAGVRIFPDKPRDGARRDGDASGNDKRGAAGADGTPGR